MPDKDHFQGKDPLKHIVEVQARGVLASSEIHGAETPGSLFAAFDAAKDMALALSLFHITVGGSITAALAFSFGFLVWKFGRASYLAWARLERLHRIVIEEQSEIQTNRSQEREELRALYAAKGFQGKLLDDVVDVLMADSERLLRVMLQEEMGFRLEENEHPLQQGLGAACGAVFSTIIILCLSYFCGQMCGFLGAILAVASASGINAFYEKNRIISAVIWNIALLAFSSLCAHYLMQVLTAV